MADIRLENLGKSFGAFEILRGIDLAISDGEFVCFLGPSGCGKSTLLRAIAGLEELTTGRIYLGGVDITHTPSARRDIAMVFQNYALYPHMTVRKNMAFGLSLNGVPRAEIERRVNSAAEILRITELLNRKPKQLSGGQRQRVAIGRAIIRDPKLFLLDEPLSNLDAGLRVTMRAELSALHARLGVTMIHVTHDQVEAMTLADRVVVLDKGRVSQFGTPLELFHRPANLFVAGFVGSPRMNFLRAGIVAQTTSSLTLQVDGAASPIEIQTESHPALDQSQPVTLGVRPDRLRLVDAAGGGLSGTIDLVERLGTESHIHFTADRGSKGTTGLSLVAITDGTHPARARQTIHVAIDPEDAHVFDAAGIAVPRKLDPKTRALMAQ